MSEKLKSRAGKLLKCLAVLNFLFWILAIIPIVMMMAGIHFLPSPDPFVPIPVWTYWALGGLIVSPFAGLISYLAFVGFSWESPGMSLLMVLAWPFGIFMTGFCVNMTFGALIPMVHTAIYGEAGSIEYVVTAPYASSGAGYGCSAGIEVETQVYGFSDLCGFGYEGRENIRKGTKLELSGRASQAGIFYKSFAIVKD